MHRDKVFGMPETLDRTLDAIHERYGVAIPVGHLLYSSPAKALLSDTTTGGWAGQDSSTAADTRVMSGGAMAYQVVNPPVGAVITTLPRGCQSVRVANVAYSRCGATYYQPVASGYRVVVLP